MSGSKQEAGLTLQEENMRVMFEFINRFHSELQIRSKAIVVESFCLKRFQVQSMLSATEFQVSIPKLTTLLQ